MNWCSTGIKQVSHLYQLESGPCIVLEEKIIPIANSDDKRQITAVLAASMTGNTLHHSCSSKGRQSAAIHKCIFQKDGTYGILKTTDQMRTL